MATEYTSDDEAVDGFHVRSHLGYTVQLLRIIAQWLSCYPKRERSFYCVKRLKASII